MGSHHLVLFERSLFLMRAQIFLVIYWVLHDNLLHLIERAVSSDWDVLLQLVDYHGILVGLVLHLISQLRDVVLFSLELLVLLIEHILHGLNCLLSCISHLFVLLLFDLVQLNCCIINYFFDHIVLWKVGVLYMIFLILLQQLRLLLVFLNQYGNLFLKTLNSTLLILIDIWLLINSEICCFHSRCSCLFNERISSHTFNTYVFLLCTKARCLSYREASTSI